MNAGLDFAEGVEAIVGQLRVEVAGLVDRLDAALVLDAALAEIDPARPVRDLADLLGRQTTEIDRARLTAAWARLASEGDPP